MDVAEAIKIIDDSLLKLPKVKVPLEKALGRVLRQQVIADVDFPPFDRVMMDGIAINYQDFQAGIISFKINGIQAAGAPQMQLEKKGECIEVMTGASAPHGSDAVIPYEEVEIDAKNKLATIRTDQFKSGKNIHVKGTDKKKGEILIFEGTLMEPPEIAVAASVGLSELFVTKNPSVAIISTGNELVEIHEKPLPHQIRRSNVYAIAAELQQVGIKSDLYHFNDEKDKLIIELGKVVENHDLVIMSGGVSKGKFDFVPETLENLGVKKLFHRIKQKPGKPFWFGTKGLNKVVFAFPGNPVSTFLCFHKYLMPWLKKSLGIQSVASKQAILAEDFVIRTNLTYFLQVETKINEKGQVLAYPKIGQGSGDHANLLHSDAFLEMPADRFEFKKGEVFNLIPFRNR